MQQALKILHAVVMKIPGVACRRAAPLEHRGLANAPLSGADRPGAVPTFLRSRWFGGVVAVGCLAVLLTIVFASPRRTAESKSALEPGGLVLIGENATGTVDLGELAVGSRTQCRFTIRNTGAAASTFAVSSSCLCGTVQPRSGVIPADGRVELVVAMEPRDFRLNGIYQITVKPDAAGIRPLQMAVRYSSPPPIIVSPINLLVESKRPSEREFVRSIRITNVHGDPVDRGGEIRTTVSHDWLAATGNSAKPSEITIRVNATMAPADGLGIVTVTHIRTGYTIYVTVHHRAEASLMIVPRHVFLRKDSRSGDYVATVLVRFNQKIRSTALTSTSQSIVLRKESPDKGQSPGGISVYSLIKHLSPSEPRSGQCTLTDHSKRLTADLSWQMVD